MESSQRGTVVFSVGDIAYYHDTTLEEVARVVVELLHCSPDNRFDLWDLVKINRILSPVPEPYQFDS